MNIFFLQTILAAPENVDKWMNILFVVVLAVFWVLRGIFKEKTKESDSKSSNQRQPSRKPIRNSSERAKALWEQFLEQTRQPADSASPNTNLPNVPQPQSKTITTGTDSQQAFNSKPLIPTSDIQPVKHGLSDLDVQGLSESSVKTVKDLEDEHSRVRSEIQEDEYISELLLDYADPEELRRAILHYEILGKPLSLRSLSDNF